MTITPAATGHNAGHGRRSYAEFASEVNASLPTGSPGPDLGNIRFGQNTPAGVPHLFGLGGPSTVCRFIAAVVIDAFERHSTGAFPHVEKKILEGEPPVANSDVALSVSMERRGIRVQAPLLHRLPTSVGRSRRYGVHVFSIGDSTVSKASAALGSRRSTVVALRPAVAPTAPPCRLIVSSPRGRSGEDGPGAKLQADDVDCKSPCGHAAQSVSYSFGREH